MHMCALTPSLDSVKNSLISASVTWKLGGMRMKIVHGCRGGFPVFGVRAPVLPVSPPGLFNSSSTFAGASGVPDVDGCDVCAAGAGVDGVASGVAAVSLRSFFALGLGAPFTLGAGLSLPSPVCGGGVEAGLLCRFERSGLGVGAFVGGALAACTAGNGAGCVLGVADTCDRRYE